MRIVGRIIAAAVVLWLLVGVTDCLLVTSAFKKPVFCIPTETADDGGSGHYVGLGWSFDIEGNFLAEDSQKPPYAVGVTRYTVYLFGHVLTYGARV